MSLDSLRLLLIGAVLVSAAFALLHESHYRSRRTTLEEAELAGMRLEIDAIKRILREDRHT